MTLEPTQKLLFIYLFTNPHAHVCGLYFLPDPFVAFDTGLPMPSLDTLWDTLSGSGLIWRDKKTQHVWVKSMLKRQGKGEKIMRSVSTHLKTLHNCSIISEFLQKYPSVKRFYRDRVSIPHPDQDEVAPRISELELELEQEQEGLARVAAVAEDIPGTAAERLAALEAFDRWSHVSCGYGISVENNHHKKIFGLIADLAQGAPVIRDKESVPAHLLIAAAADRFKDEGKNYKHVNYAVSCVKGKIEDWKINGILSNGKQGPAPARKTLDKARIDKV